VAGLLKVGAAGKIPRGSLVVCTVTGHGLKDPDTALLSARSEGGTARGEGGARIGTAPVENGARGEAGISEPLVVPADPDAIAAALGLA
jgi:threonine synthase